MTKNEEWREDEKFQAWRRSLGLELIIEIEAAWLGYSTRQPEIDALKENNEGLALAVALLRAEVERLRDAADRAEGFLFAVSLMPQLGPKVQDVALRHHEALRAAMKETK